MNLQPMLAARAAAGKPVRVGLIGAGKFGSMFLAQVPFIAGLELAVVADLDPDRAKAACRNVGWDSSRIARTRFAEHGRDTCLDERVDVVVEATGNPAAGIAHALEAIEARKHIVMVNVEADALAGAWLAKKAQATNVIYSMAYGDQPALIAEMVDWARATGFAVVAAGKGTKYLPTYHTVTPDHVWEHYGLTAEEARAAGMNSQMFNSFLDGTKSAIEMAAVANACGLDVPHDGLGFPPCGAAELASVLRPKKFGGVLAAEGMVEVVSSLERDGKPVARDLRWGVYVVFKAQSDYAASCFKQYGLPTDATGRYAAMYKPVPSDRPGTVNLSREPGAARRADRKLPRLPRRRSRCCQARAQGRRDARRRRRLHGLRQARSRGAQPRAWRAADRACKPRQACARCCGGRIRQGRRRRARRECASRPYPTRDGTRGAAVCRDRSSGITLRRDLLYEAQSSADLPLSAPRPDALLNLLVFGKPFGARRPAATSPPSSAARTRG
jgi:predicted homoserine dehydrogenase-like protein